MNGSNSTPFSSAERRLSAAGFTLVEVLVATAILALLLASIYGIFAPIGTATARVEAEAEGYHQARVLMDRIGREVRGAYFNLQPGTKTRFAGGTLSDGRPYLLLSTTAATPRDGAGGIALVRYELQADPEAAAGAAGQVLLRGEAPLFFEDAEGAPLYRLGAGIVGLGLRFFDGSSWQEQWPVADAAPGLPEQVEVTLRVRIEGVEVPFATIFELPR